jgi:short-subunit dehydrogenase
VTGASRGLGKAFAERLAAAGYEVTVVARSKAPLDALVARLGKGHRVLTADLSSTEGISAVVEDVRSRAYDIVINNAAACSFQLFHQSDLGEELARLRVNIDSVVAISHAFLQGAARGGALLNIGSMISTASFPGAAAYGGTKAFIASFTEALWWENVPRGVYVGALLPGPVDTSFHASAGGPASALPPAALTQSAEEVVEAGMTALTTRAEALIVSGAFANAFLLGARLLPRKLVVGFFGKMSPTKRDAL